MTPAHLRHLFRSTVLPAFLAISTPVFACISFPATPFTGVTTTAFDAHWNSVCPSTSTSYFFQVAETPGFSPLTFATTVATNTASVSNLATGVTYFVRVSTNPGMSGALSLGSVTTSLLAAAQPQSVSAGAVSILFPPASFAVDFALRLTTQPLTAPTGGPSTPAMILEAQDKLLRNTGDSRRRPVPGTLMQAVAQNAGGQRIFPQGPYVLTLAYSETNGFVDGLSPPVRPQTLAVHGLDEVASLWVRLPGDVNLAAHSVTALVTDPDMSVFALIGKMDGALNDVFAYPQPFEPGRGQSAVTFANMAQQASLSLFTATGREIRALHEGDGDGRLTWDGRDENGESVPSGVYFYVIESPTDKKTGKLMVIR